MSKFKNLTFHTVMRWSGNEALEFLETMRWPDGPICPKCGADEPYRITRKTASKNNVRTLFKCRACRRQFSATVGTIFEDSKLPLQKWLAAMYLMCSSKKGISAHQLHRMLDIGYRAAWFMCHRIRNAMEDDSGDLLNGEVEVDETYIGPRSKRGHPVVHERIKDEEEMGLRPRTPRSPPYQDKTSVFGMIERGGRARSVVVDRVRSNIVHPVIEASVDMDETTLYSDGHSVYRSLGRRIDHRVVDHEVEYVRGDVHTQNIENYWSIFKRGLHGTFHHVDAGYLPMYLHEFDFRASHREISDAERFLALMSQTRGRLFWFCRTKQPENPYA